MKRPPWLLEPIDIWRAYKRLVAERVRGNPAGTLADIVMLVRYAVGEATTLEPLPSTSLDGSIFGSDARRRPAAPIPTNKGPG